MEGRPVRSPVTEDVAARWLGMTRLVTQFSDGIKFRTRPDLPRLRVEGLLAGDVLICSSTGGSVDGVEMVADKMGGSLRLLTRGIFTHAAIVGGDGLVFEAALPVVASTPFADWIGNFAYAVVLRHRTIAGIPENEMAVKKLLKEAVGARYDWWRAAETMLVGRVDQTHRVARMAVAIGRHLEGTRSRKRYNCSTLVWSALAAGGVTDEDCRFGRHVTPADYVDRLLLNPVGYVTEQCSLVTHRLDIHAARYIIEMRPQAGPAPAVR